MGETMDGIRYAARHPGLGPILLFAAVSALLLRGVQEILPPFVDRAFGRGAESLAVLTAAFGVGALLIIRGPVELLPPLLELPVTLRTPGR